jgi:hypothetical protein
VAEKLFELGLAGPLGSFRDVVGMLFAARVIWSLNPQSRQFASNR